MLPVITLLNASFTYNDTTDDLLHVQFNISLRYEMSHSLTLLSDDTVIANLLSEDKRTFFIMSLCPYNDGNLFLVRMSYKISSFS